MLSRTTPHPHLDADLNIDLDAIETAAHRAADHAMARPTPGCTTTWQSTYDRAYARYLDLAEGARATALWQAEQDAEIERRKALPARERRILALREIAHLAPMIDCTREAIAEQEAAERELAALMAEAV